jgi:superfamily II DNA or RNA helicase
MMAEEQKTCRMTRLEALLFIGDALYATDDVQEENFIGFNKPDKAIWMMVRENEPAMVALLYKYQRQARDRFGDDVVRAVGEWKLPEDGGRADLERAKGLTREKRQAGKDRERQQAEQARLQLDRPRVVISPDEATGGLRLDLVGARLGRDLFNQYLDATRRLRGKFLGNTWVVPRTADLAGYKQQLEAIGILVEGEIPVLTEAEKAAAAVDVRIEMIGDGHIGIFHPYCPKMNQAYQNAEETSGIIGWNPERKCRVVGADEPGDLHEVMAAITKTHPEWTVLATFDLDAYYAEQEQKKLARRTPTVDMLAQLKDGIQPLPSQVEGVHFLDQLNGNALVGDDMGLGKTFQLLLWAAKRRVRTVVVLPKNVRRQWLQEAARFFKDGVFSGFEIDSRKTPNDVNLAPYNLVTINYEILAKYQNAIQQAGFDLLVVDESHRIKNPKAKITQIVTQLGQDFQYKILLSGTPIKNKKKEIFTQANLVRPGTFKSERDVQWMTTFAAKEAIKTFFFRRTKKAELKNLPPKLRSIVQIPGYSLPDYQPGMEIGEISALKSALARAKTPMTIEFVEDILDGSDSKVIVFSDSDDAARQIAEHFGEVAVLHVGATPHEKREAAKAVFMDEASPVRVFVATTGSCREGVNLTVADRVVFNDLPWVPSDMAQAEDRAHRMGQQAECVNVYWVCAAGNRFDEKIVQTLFRKMEIYKKIIDGKKPTAEEKKFLDEPIVMGVAA